MPPYSTTVYARHAESVRTDKDIEYDIIAKITQRLAFATAKREENFPEFIEALFRNEEMWSTLATDIAKEENLLPQPLRARLFYLYRFTVEHSIKVRHNKANADVLVDINKAILKGLRGEGVPA